MPSKINHVDDFIFLFPLAIQKLRFKFVVQIFKLLDL